MKYPTYEVIESCDDDLDQLLDLLGTIRNQPHHFDERISVISHRGTLELIGENGDTICEINIY